MAGVWAHAPAAADCDNARSLTFWMDRDGFFFAAAADADAVASLTGDPGGEGPATL